VNQAAENETGRETVAAFCVPAHCPVPYGKEELTRVVSRRTLRCRHRVARSFRACRRYCRGLAPTVYHSRLSDSLDRRARSTSRLSSRMTRWVPVCCRRLRCQF
jgi:hypothetical protein